MHRVVFSHATRRSPGGRRSFPHPTHGRSPAPPVLLTLFLPWLLLSLTAPVDARETALTLVEGEYPVPAILSLPDDTDAPGPAVLLLHGTASQKNEVGDLFYRLAARLAAAGIASLRIDFAGAGDSPVDHGLFTLSSAVTDALQALDFLQSLEAVNPGAVAVLGFSQGGLIAQRVALRAPGTLALLTWSTVAVDGPGSFQRFFDQYYARAQAEGSVPVPFPWLDAPLNFSLQWFAQIETQRSLSEMRDYPGPILAIAGLADVTVPPQQSVDLVAQSPHPQSRAVLLAGADHIFNVLQESPTTRSGPRHDQQLLDISTRWLLEVLAAP